MGSCASARYTSDISKFLHMFRNWTSPLCGEGLEVVLYENSKNDPVFVAAFTSAFSSCSLYS